MYKNKTYKKTIKLIPVNISETVFHIFILLAGISLISMMLTGCSMLPQKEVINAAPVLKEYEPVSYNLVNVERGTVALGKDIDCTYAQMKEEDLSFSLTGIKISNINCSAGDAVKKGDLLAELDISGLEKELSEAEYSIGELNLLISQNKDLSELEVERQKLLNRQSGLTGDAADEAVAAIQDKYNAAIQSYEDELYLAEMEKSSVTEKIENCRIYAGMDGTVSYVKQMPDGKESLKNEVIIKIIDNSQSAFVASAGDATYFTEGEKVTVNTADSSYETTVLTSQAAEGFIYFLLTTPDLNLGIGESGSIHIELEKQDNVLYLPVDAVHKAGDSYYVYYVDETGVQNMKTVEVGIQSNDYIEIISGLEYGEAVIDK